MAKTIEELLKEALVPVEEQPYEVPENWVWSRLGCIAEWSSGGTPKSTRPEFYDGDIPWLVIGDLNDGYVYDSNKKITDQGLKNSSAKLVKVDSILLAMYGSIGKLGINKVECTTNQAIAFTKEIYKLTFNKYLFYYLLNSREKLIKLGKGGTQQNISQTVIKEVEIPIPPLAEQQRIVTKIESLFSKIDKAKELIEEAREGFENRKAAILAKAFKGELTEKWREENPSIRSSESMWNIDNEVEGHYEAVAIPKTWCQRKLKDICERVSVGHVGPTTQYYCSSTDGIPFLRSQNVKPGRVILDDVMHITKEFHNKLKKTQLKAGDLLIVRVGANRGDAAILSSDLGEVNCANIVFARPIGGLSNYLGYFFISNIWRNTVDKITTGSAQGVINTKIVSEVIIPLPPLEEQKEIVRILDNLLSFESKIEELTQLEEQIELLKKSILAKAFRGELGTNDPTEESAIELLKEVLKDKIK